MKLIFAFFLVILPALCFSRSVGSVPASGDASEGTEKLMDDMKEYLQHPGKAKESKLLADVGVKNGQPPPCPTTDVQIRDASKIKKIVESFDEKHRAIKEELLKILEDGKFTAAECQKVDQEVKEFAQSAGSSEADDASGDKADGLSSGSFLGTDLLLRRRRKALFSPLADPHSFEGRVVLIWTTITNRQICMSARHECEQQARNAGDKKLRYLLDLKSPRKHFSCVLNCGFKTDGIKNKYRDGVTEWLNPEPFCISKGDATNNKKHCAEDAAQINAKEKTSTDYNVLWTKQSPCNKNCCPVADANCGKTGNLYEIDQQSTLGGLWLLCYGKPWGKDQDKNYLSFQGRGLQDIIETGISFPDGSSSP